MSLTIPDHKIALRDYLATQPAITAICSPERIVLDYAAIRSGGHWLWLSRAGGMRDLETPVRRARIDLVSYGPNRWEALRLIETAAAVLGLSDPRRVPRITGAGVIITDVRPDGDITEGIDDRVPGGPLPFMVQSLIATVHQEG